MKPHMPQTDSIEELAAFWDSHDVTDFDDELEEVPDRVFAPTATVPVLLTPAEREALRKMAATRGVEEAALIHEWVREKLLKSS